MTNKEKKIPPLLNNKDYLKHIFADRIKDIDPRAVSIARVESYKIKDHLDHNFFHYVILNKVTITTKANLRKRFDVFCVAFSAHGRKKMYQILEAAYKHGFDRGGILVPTPLWYIDDLMAAFYIGIPGDNFLEHIKNGHLDHTSLKKIAKGLFNLHHINPKNIKLSKHKFSLDYLDPTDVLSRPHNKKYKLSSKIKQQYKNLKQLHKKIIDDKYVLSHGDFHPENVIINRFKANQVAIIDFSEGCLAPIYFDIASFLQQLEFMARSYINSTQYQKLEAIFLNSYFSEVAIDSKLKNKINLYKSWTALKSAVYFMIFEDDMNRGFAKYLLRWSKGLIRNIGE